MPICLSPHLLGAAGSGDPGTPIIARFSKITDQVGADFSLLVKCMFTTANPPNHLSPRVISSIGLYIVTAPSPEGELVAVHLGQKRALGVLASQGPSR